MFADIDRAMDDSCLISVAPHPERNCIYDELIVCVALGKDDEGVMRKQVDLIRSAGFPEKNGLFETNIIYRDHHDYQVIEVMKDWWSWIENYSRRDQLSLPYVLWQHKLEAKSLTDISYRYNDGIEFINNTNHVTKEELIVQRDQLQQAINLRDGQVAHFTQTIQNLTEEVAKRDAVVADRDGQIAGLNNVTLAYNEALRTIEEIRVSSSWRITAPMRYVSSKIRNIIEVLKLLPRIIRFGGGVVGSVRKTWRVFSREGWKGIKRRILFVGGNRSQYFSSTIKQELISESVDQNDYGEPVLSLPFGYSQRLAPPEGRIAVILHAFYPDLAPELRRYLDNICRPFDLFVSTDTEVKAISLRRAFADVTAGSVDVRIVPNRGRDITTKLITFRDVYDSHSFVIHLHTKTSNHDARLARWRSFILDCLLGSPAIVESVLEAFTRMPQLGIVAPRNFPTVRPYMNWDINFVMARTLAARMGITITPDSALDFPVGSMFWARSAALRPLLDLELSFEDFPAEVGQTDGTLAHAIERLYFYACEKSGLRWVHAGNKKDIQPPEWLFSVNDPADLQLCVSDQIPSLILPGIRPRPTGIPANQMGVDALKRAFRDICEQDLDEFLAGNGRIMMRVSDSPEVSILLVLFNQAELTFHCLQSLQRALDLPAEVIIVDNASTDRTDALLARVDGVRILKTYENLHFLHGVNAAAEKARGKYLLLLNNDTRLKAGSIAVACRRLEEEKSIGAVGGKIVLPNGTLQEAGSIIWRDGSCVGYGRGRDPGDAEFQFRRDVDYCSGALLMVRKDLFEHLGRFDSKYAPAYYEETDLCMRIRKAGFRVVYDPDVEVTHFEFGSLATSDEAIALQQRNRIIFTERHSSALAVYHLQSDTRHLDARMRMQNIGRVLVVDDRVPFPSLGAGYPRASQIIKALIKAGWFVTHYPLIFPYVRFSEAYALFPREVEILAGLGQMGLVEFLQRRVGYYDTVIVSRPHNMALFGGACRIVPEFLANTQLIYDAEAVFAVREALRTGKSNSGAFKTKVQRKIAEEIALATQARIVVTVNEIEAGFFRKAGHSDVRVLGHNINVAPTASGFTSRRNLLFVGALNEDASPNADSLVWFVNEVMPKLDRLIGTDYVLNVVGRNGSPKIRALGDTRVKLLGRIEDIRNLYDSSRVFIAPTRFAGGIPMKVHEAASMGLPVVATSLLGRQLGWTDETELLTADRPEDFALACQRLYEDPKLWCRIREAALIRVGQDCNPDRFEEIIHSMLRDVVHNFPKDGTPV